jgi:hypothetical protein
VITVQELLDADRARLMELLRSGHPIDPTTLDDTLYEGISLGLGALVERLTWKKFGKTFRRDPETGQLRGWNVRMDQDGLHAPWTPTRDRTGAPLTFGHYRVVQPSGPRIYPGTDRGLLIHYGLGGNRRRDPLGRARDPIVAVNPGSAELLLGWTYLDLGRGPLIPTPSFFSLAPGESLQHSAAPPR